MKNITFDSVSKAIQKLQELINTKVDKISGKGLSTNDYSSADKKIVDGVMNKNILINSDWRIPVNQKGMLEYTKSGYGIDMWRRSTLTTTPGSLSVVSGGILLKNNSTDTNILYRQYIENAILYNNLMVTLSINVLESTGYPGAFSVRRSKGSLGEVIIKNVAVPEGTTGILINTIQLPNNLEAGEVLEATFSNAPNSSIKIERIKLELGSISTLANDPPVNYGTELTKCQRYQSLAAFSTGTVRHIKLTGRTSATLFFDVPLTTTLRIHPNIVHLDDSAYLAVHEFSTLVEETEFEFTAMATEAGARISAAKTAHGLTDAQLRISKILLDANIY